MSHCRKAEETLQLVTDTTMVNTQPTNRPYNGYSSLNRNYNISEQYFFFFTNSLIIASIKHWAVNRRNLPNPLFYTNSASALPAREAAMMDTK